MARKIEHIAVFVLIMLLVSGSSRCSENRQTAKGDQHTTDKTDVSEKRQTEGETEMTIRGVDDGSRPETRRLSSVDDRVVRGNTAFGFRLLAEISEDADTQNLFFSPLSISLALAMAYNGASGETAEAIARALGFEGRQLAELNQTMADLTMSLERADSSVEFSIANSMWGRKGFSFADAFLERNRTFYDAEVASLDFDAPDAPDRINLWVNQATHGKITKIVGQIPPEIVLYLINAIYFKGQWKFEFDPAMTSDRPFYLPGGEEQDVPMMARSGGYRYAETPDLQAVRMPYGKDRIAMYVFLPSPPSDLNTLLSKLDDETWSRWMSAFEPRKGEILLPRFKMEYETLLNSALKTIGMGVAFTPGVADFSQMTPEPAELYISQVLHKAVVEVNEEGTEAAAVTAISIGVTSVEPEEERFRFVADRPFFFVIRDDLTGSVLFMGAVNDPISR